MDQKSRIAPRRAEEAVVNEQRPVCQAVPVLSNNACDDDTRVQDDLSSGRGRDGRKRDLIRQWMSSRDIIIRELQAQIATVKSQSSCGAVKYDHEDSMGSSTLVNTYVGKWSRDEISGVSPQIEPTEQGSMPERTLDNLGNNDLESLQRHFRDEIVPLKHRLHVLEKSISDVVQGTLRNGACTDSVENHDEKMTEQGQVIGKQAEVVPSKPIKKSQADDLGEEVASIDGTVGTSAGTGDDTQGALAIPTSPVLDDKIDRAEEYVRDAMESFMKRVEERQAKYESNAAVRTQRQLNLFQESSITKEEKTAICRLVESFSGQLLSFQGQMVRLQKVEPSLVKLESLMRYTNERLQYCERAVQDIVVANCSMGIELKRERREGCKRVFDGTKVKERGVEKLVVHIPRPEGVAPSSSSSSPSGASAPIQGHDTIDRKADGYTIPLATEEKVAQRLPPIKRIPPRP